MVDVPAGEWRILRFDARDFSPEQELTWTLIAHTAESGAEPWTGFAQQFVDDTDNTPYESSPAAFNFSGSVHPERGAYFYGYTWDANGVPAHPEVALIVGSNRGDSTFYIGDVGEPLQNVLTVADDNGYHTLIVGGADMEQYDNRTLMEDLLDRPRLSLETAAGRNGFGARFLRYVGYNGEIVEQSSPNINIRSKIEGSVSDGVAADLEIELSGNYPLPSDGMAAYYLEASRQAGLSDYEYSIVGPEHDNSSHGTYVGGLYTSLRGPDWRYGDLRAVDQFGATSGELSIYLRHDFSGKEGGGLGGYANGAAWAIDGIPYIVAEWGYIGADFRSLYGWNTQD